MKQSQTKTELDEPTCSNVWTVERYQQLKKSPFLTYINDKKIPNYLHKIISSALDKLISYFHYFCVLKLVLLAQNYTNF